MSDQGTDRARAPRLRQQSEGHLTPSKAFENPDPFSPSAELLLL